ncbi:MAG: response regulator [Planctomycetaceae bacterium]|nr:response regulator [Planctomycetaceae bacterium]
MRIIVADDEPDMREYFQTILSVLGHEVLAVAADGEELVARCIETIPEVVITDLRMPLLNGDEAIRRIWQRIPVPVVFISAFPFPEDLKLSAPTTALRYLNKPINRNQLREVLDSLSSPLPPKT